MGITRLGVQSESESDDGHHPTPTRSRRRATYADFATLHPQVCSHRASRDFFAPPEIFRASGPLAPTPSER